MGILPVFLFHKNDPTKRIKVYASLDNASGETFVSDLVLKTIYRTCNVTMKAIEGLVVANIKEDDATFDLTRTFTRNIVPADCSKIL